MYADIGPNFGRLRSSLAHVGRSFPDFDRHRPNAAHIRPGVGRFPAWDA